MTEKTLSAELIAWQKRNGYSTYQASEVSGIPRTTLHRYRSSPGSIPDNKMLELLAKILNVTPEQVLLMAYNETMNKKNRSR